MSALTGATPAMTTPPVQIPMEATHVNAIKVSPEMGKTALVSGASV